MKSLPRLFAAVLVPFFILSVLSGCSGLKSSATKTLTSIAVTPTTPAHLKVGATQQFAATATFSDGTTSDISATVAWTSATTATATISTAGLATGVAGGTTQITASQGGVTSPPVTLTVIVLASIVVTPGAPTIAVGATQQFAARGTYSDSSFADITSTVTWHSGTTATATISTAGLATGIAQGTTQITASMSGVTSPAVTLTVISLTSIAVTPNPASVAVNATIQFTATGTYSDASTANITTQVTWASTPASVATIGASTGLATGVANGTSQITATLSGITSPADTLTVGTGGTPVPIALKITPANPSIVTGQTEDFTAVELLSNGATQPTTGTVTWSSGTPATASIVSTAGIAAGLAAGTSTITATEGTLTGNTTLTVAAAVPRFVYTIGPNDGVTSGFAINTAAGAPAPLPALADNPDTPLQLVFEPSGQFAYGPGAQGNISIYSINSVSGVLAFSGLTPAPITSFVSGTSSILQSAVDPSGRYLYVLDSGKNLVNAYSIDTTNSATKGTLAKIPSTPTVATGSSPAGLVVHPSGKFLYVTNLNDNTVSAYTIASDGGLTAITLSGTIFTTAGVNGPELPVIDPTGQFLYVPNTLASPGSVSGFTIDTTTGALTAMGAATTSASLVGAFGTAIDPAGKFLFVTNSGGNNVVVFPIGAGGSLGTAASFTSGTAATSGPLGIAIDPSGSFAATANNLENTMTLFTLANGVLTPNFNTETRTTPEFVSFYSGVSAPVIRPLNVFAANGGSGDISGFTAVSSTGVLGTATTATGQSANAALAADITGNFLYSTSASGKSIGGFSITQSSAALAALTGTPFRLTTAVDVPADIATEPTSRTLLVADTTGNLIETFSAGNSPASKGTTTFASVNDIAVDPQGTYVAAFGSNSITVAAISGFTGTLGCVSPPPPAPPTPPPCPTGFSQAGNWIAGSIDPTGHWIVALDSVGKALQPIAFTPIQNGFTAPDGTLTAQGLPLSTGLTTPSAVTFDPLGRFVFVSDTTAGKVAVFSFNESTGALAALGTPITVDATGTGKVSVDASGTYLYAAVTGNGGSVPSAVAAYKINSNGTLAALAGSPFPTGASTSGTSGVTVTSRVQ